jgi:asparagine synthase (glutamine-hydrolysing)
MAAMSVPPHDLALGTPLIDGQAVDSSAAWRDALARLGPKGAAAAARGGFAVGLDDGEHGAFLAVDRFAEHSLCYRVEGNRLRFAARADELADSAEIDAQAIYDYLYFHVIPSPRTVFAGVQRLPPGHCARLEQGRLRVEPYWTPRFDATSPADFAALRDEFRDLLRNAVRRRLDGGKPACFLSGGTDSSTVAGLVGEVTGRPAASYSIGFEAEGYDEMAYARIAARHFGCEHHEYYVTPDDLVRSIGEVAAACDQPFGNSSLLPAHYCARMARADGVTRLLAGDGGDELFGGNSRYAKQRVFGWYQCVPAALRTGVLEPLLERSPLGRLPLLRKGASYVGQAKVAMPDRLQMYNLLLRLGPQELLTPDFLARIDAQAPARQQREVWAQASASEQIDRTLAYDWRYTLAESDLPKVRWATSLADVEVGFPLLDADLLDFSLRLPAHYKLKGLQLRWFFKEALRGFLPDAVITKKKQGFGLPFGVWATRHPALNALATDSLASFATRGVVRPEFIGRLTGELLPAHPGYYGELVWILMMLEQWLRRHAPGWRAR